MSAQIQDQRQDYGQDHGQDQIQGPGGYAHAGDPSTATSGSDTYAQSDAYSGGGEYTYEWQGSGGGYEPETPVVEEATIS